MDLPILITDAESKTRPIQVSIKIEIPKKYHKEGLISQLISLYHLQVNIIGALLCQDGSSGGWFDLELKGTYDQIKNALVFLTESDVIIWKTLTKEYDGW
jgi:hypothetical protein